MVQAEHVLGGSPDAEALRPWDSQSFPWSAHYVCKAYPYPVTMFSEPK
jgi:hypothetical protein